MYNDHSTWTPKSRGVSRYGSMPGKIMPWRGPPWGGSRRDGVAPHSIGSARDGPGSVVDAPASFVARPPYYHEGEVRRYCATRRSQPASNNEGDADVRSLHLTRPGWADRSPGHTRRCWPRLDGPGPGQVNTSCPVIKLKQPIPFRVTSVIGRKGDIQSRSSRSSVAST